MDAVAIYRAERARRGLSTACVSLAIVAKRAGITRRAMYYQLRGGALTARQVQWKGERWQWVVEPAEAERWLRQYRWNARTKEAA